MVDDKGIGLVLAGGGAKGAYQVGVWKALCEMGLDRVVTGIAGTSIGAINALLFSSIGLEEALRVWTEATDDVFLAPLVDEDGDGLSDKGFKNAICETAGGVLPLIPHKPPQEPAERAEPAPDPLAGFDPEQREDVSDRLLAAMSESVSALKALGAVGRVSSKAKAAGQRRALRGMYSNRNLSALVDKMVPDKLALARPTYATVYSISKQEPVYYDLGGGTREHAVQTVLASACLPGVYAPMQLDGELVSDGGLGDNRPIKPLYDAGWRRFVVVHLNGIAKKGVREALAADQERFPDAVIVPMLPGGEFDDSFMGGTMNVNPKASARRIALGYEECMRQFSTLRLFPDLTW